MVRLPIAQVGRRHTLVAAIALLCLLGLLPIAQTSARPTPPHPPQFYAQARQMVFLPLVNRSELGQLAVQAILDPDGVPKIAVMNANGRERAVVSGGLMPTLEMVARWPAVRLYLEPPRLRG